MRLIQERLWNRKVSNEIAWATMVLLLKGRGEYRVIGLVEMLWKVCSVVVNCWLNRSVVLNRNGNCEQGCEGKLIPKKSNLSG